MFESILSIAFVIALLAYFIKKAQLNNYKRIMEMTEGEGADWNKGEPLSDIFFPTGGSLLKDLK